MHTVTEPCALSLSRCVFEMGEQSAKLMLLFSFVNPTTLQGSLIHCHESYVSC